VASKKTWIWVLVAGFGLMVLAMAAVAGAGLYFVVSHISTDRSSSADALRTFDEIRAGFHDQKPLFELDSEERPQPTRDIADLPTSTTRPENLVILAWDPDDERLAKISLPFWMLRLGRRNIEFQHDSGFDLDELNLDVDQLERVGPVLIFDFRTSDGERVLIWTR
jgi:hypothetical protein